MSALREAVAQLNAERQQLEGKLLTAISEFEALTGASVIDVQLLRRRATGEGRCSARLAQARRDPEADRRAGMNEHNDRIGWWLFVRAIVGVALVLALFVAAGT